MCKYPKNRPLIIAHRGASQDAPENTLPAFCLAWQQGADGIEGDFQLTADGHIVCIHDQDTRRVTDSALVVSKSTLTQLRNLDAGRWRGTEFKNTEIPTVAEVFATMLPGKNIYIEIKCGIEIIPLLLEAITEAGLHDNQVVVISFSQEVIREMRHQAPQYKAFWLCNTRKDGSIETTPSVDAILNTLRDIGATGVSCNKDGIDEKFAEAIITSGYELHVWTVDDIETARSMRKWGAMSITTNTPGEIRKHLFG